MYHERLAVIDYKSQMDMAKQRGIKWKFTFQSWVRWWVANLGPDWQFKRGRKKGEYVMARKGDEGPYHPNNVDCVTCSKNSSDANRGERSPRAYTTNAIALKIFLSEGTRLEIATFFGVPLRVVRGIKEQTSYRYVTTGLTPPPPRKRGLVGDQNPNIKITDEQAAEIITSDIPARVFAERYGVKIGHIYDIRKRLRRRNVRVTPKGRYRPQSPPWMIV